MQMRKGPKVRRNKNWGAGGGGLRSFGYAMIA